jgi:hypothetical protein
MLGLNGEQLALDQNSCSIGVCLINHVLDLIVPSAFEIWIVATILVFF